MDLYDVFDKYLDEEWLENLLKEDISLDECGEYVMHNYGPEYANNFDVLAEYEVKYNEKHKEQGPSSWVRFNIALNYETTDIETLKTLAEQDDSYVDEGLAINPATPEDILLKMWNKYKEGKYSNTSVHDKIIRNPNIPAEIILEFAEKGDDELLNKYKEKYRKLFDK